MRNVRKLKLIFLDYNQTGKPCDKTTPPRPDGSFVFNIFDKVCYHLNGYSNDMSGKIKKGLKNEKAVLQCAEQFGLVGDPTRMKICWLLCKHPELSVGEITKMLGVSISVVSHSLKKLRENNLVNSRRDHKVIYYKFSNTSFNKILKKVSQTYE